MAAVRVLIVDDSVVVRKVLTTVLSSDPNVEVVGSAANGSIGLQKIPQLKPDVVILDVEMPEMDGLETLRHIRAGWPALPVVMCSSLTERGADTTLRALANGASDYVTKPSMLGANDGADMLAPFRDELLRKLKAIAGVLTIAPPPPPPPAIRQTPRPARPREAVAALAFGCSTGGPNALARVFEGLPKDLDVPIFIVQHMPPLFTKLLADRLAASSGMAVSEATHGEVVEPGHVYVAPGDFHMGVIRLGLRVRIALNQDPQENSCRPAVDVLFRSLAKVYGGGVLGAVLTGMGHDGANGARAIVDAGGSVVVQDLSSCVVPSMPSAIAMAGLSDGVFTLDRMPVELAARIRRVAPVAGSGPGASRELGV